MRHIGITFGLLALSFPVLGDSFARMHFVLQNHEALPYVDERYAQHPMLTLLHLLPGVAFFLIGPLQFNPVVRRRILLHRIAGRVFVASGVVSSLGVMAMVLVFPALGGWLTISVTWGICLAMMGAMFLAVQAVRHRNLNRHELLMRLAFSLGLSVSTARIYITGAEVLFGISFVDSFAFASALGVWTNLAALACLERQTIRRQLRALRISWLA